MSRITIIALVMMVASLGLFARAEAGGFYASFYGPEVAVSFGGPWYGGYWGPIVYGPTFSPVVVLDGDRFHPRHDGWHRGHDDRWEHGGHHGRGRGGHR